MKNKKIICLLLVFLIIILTVNINSYAATLPELMITSNNYSVGDKMSEDDIQNVEVGKTLQLYAIIAHGNDMFFVDDPDSIGIFVDEVNLEGVTWTSSNDEIATVDNTGKVTGVAEGDVTITATYEGQTAEYEINVEPVTIDLGEPRIVPLYTEPEPAKIINQEKGITFYLYNIPNTERENIEFTIDNEKIAEIILVDLGDTENEEGISEIGVVTVYVKFLALGVTTLNVTLDYNGKTYSSSYTLDVVESAYSLKLSAKEYTDLPETLEVGNKIQLTAMFNVYGGALIPKDVTSDGVTWTSSNEKVAKVDNKGLVTAVGEGTATITATYKVGDETVTATYNLKITDSTKTPVVNPTPDPTTAKTVIPQAGENTIIMMIGITVVLSVLVIIYKKYKNYKDVK